ncbi:AAA family ATPase [Planktothricoides sp. SR001]|uniref:P-loop NTPase fold protein n=1 Tax=Planktothricoides sp. SR001 TaxID=1705388 RepID=UPI0006C732F2|nr:P-loop NTPase fold protein [Planktothricoides sp. SR001]KOR34908.1 AAA family ATPase [Planktothricoides sp. SR001]
MSQELLQKFQQAYKNLDLSPLLSATALAEFGIEYQEDTIIELEQLVEDSPIQDSKIIFTGHRGCGKSTLLADFSRRMQENYFVVLFSIADMIEMSDVNHINILFAIALQLMDEADRQNVPVPKSTKEAIEKWFARKIRIETNQLSTETSAGFNLFKILAGKLKVDATIRQEIKQEFIRKTSELVEQINIIAAIIKSASGKNPLVIIDDLDKLDLGLVRDIFQDHIKALFSPNFTIIFTLPVSALREMRLKETIESASKDQIVFMRVSKLFAKWERREADAKPKPEVMNQLKQLLSKRISSDILEAETAEKIILYSGGVLRELIRISNECCRICLRLLRRYPDRDDLKINHQILAEAVNKIRLDFELRLGLAEYEIVTTTYKELMPENPTEQKFLDLLHGLYILEYRNHDLWYDVHPIVTESLQKQRRI